MGRGAWQQRHGVTMAIVDAYESPTLLADAQLYFRRNDPAYPLKSSQFAAVEPSSAERPGLVQWQRLV